MSPSSISNTNRNQRRGVPLVPGRYYHVYNRGNNGENIFIEERNYTYFLKLYAQYLSPVADTYAYCLLRNHFHLLVRVKESAPERSERSERSDRLDPVTRGFTSLFQSYSMAMNKAYNRTGKLFQEHFARIEVTSDAYFTNLIFYVHFNPQKHGFLSDFREWPWSSYVALTSAQPTRLQRDAVLAWFDGYEPFARFHRGAVDERSITPLIADDVE
jgi:putative transposase